MLKTYSINNYIKSLFLNMALVTFSFTMSYYKPSNDSILFYFWFFAAAATYVIWLKIENTILNKLLFLILAPLCVFINFVGTKTTTTLNEGIHQYVLLNFIVISSWLLLALWGDIKKVKPAMLIIEAVLKSVAAVLGIMFFLNKINTDTNWPQLKTAIDILILPLILAAIWGRLFLEIRTSIHKLIHCFLFELLSRYFGVTYAIISMRKTRKFLKIHFVD
ncbi:hypothetical protein [Azotosporobacter soli]|uniref:hypothetical protein n=1 Tax=Azotosporobacter soli TaxID=3055040 RepID=UPI0031FE86B8